MGSSRKRQSAWYQALIARTKGLLDGEHGLELHAEPGREYFCRPGELLVGAQEAQDLAPELARLKAEPTEADLDLGLALYRLPAGVRVHDAVEQLRRSAQGRDVLVGPHHALFAAPRWCGGPGGPARPTDAVGLKDGDRGEGITIAVLDSGQSAASMQLDWVRDHVDVQGIDPVDSDGDGRIDPEAGHGTFVSGVIAQAAPGVRVLALRVLDGEGITDELTVVRAVRQALADGAQILNLSLGGYTYSDSGARAIDLALAKAGVVAVAAAGNDGVDRPFYPAASDRVIGVAALNRWGKRAWFSNYGEWVDACADGVELRSTYVSGDEAREWEFDGVDHFAEPYATWSGTSFATPQVAAAIAVRAQQHGEDVVTAAAAVLAGAHRPLLGARVRTSVRSTA